MSWRKHPRLQNPSQIYNPIQYKYSQDNYKKHVQLFSPLPRQNAREHRRERLSGERRFTITTNVTSGRHYRRNHPIRRCSISRALGHGWSTAPLLHQPGHRRLDPRSCFWCSIGDYLGRNVSGFFFLFSFRTRYEQGLGRRGEYTLRTLSQPTL